MREKILYSMDIKKIEKRINSKILYVVSAVLLMLFTKEDSLILNISIWISMIIYLVSLVISLVFSYFYSSDEEIIDRLFSIIITNFLLFVLLKYLFIFGIKQMAEDKEIVGKYPIENFISGRVSKLYFRFNGKKYGVGYSNKEELRREEMIKNYEVLLFYNKSILGTYIIRDYKIIHRNDR